MQHIQPPNLDIPTSNLLLLLVREWLLIHVLWTKNFFLFVCVFVCLFVCVKKKHLQWVSNSLPIIHKYSTLPLNHLDTKFSHVHYLNSVVYILYIWGLVGLYTTIQPPQPRFFSSSAGKFPRAARRALGRKKTEVEAAILLYIARRDPIYIIYIPLVLFQLRKETLSKFS